MIEIKDMSFTYKGTEQEIIKNINLKINEGECVLICGKSGSGKTSLLRVINGLIPHFYGGDYEGSVVIDGMEVKDTPMYKLSKKIGTVYQNPRSQFFNIDTTSEVAFGIENMAYPKEEIHRRVNKAIVDANISHVMERSIFELSGGEKQKIAFASVFAMEPDIYLLDEPSSNLDAECTLELQRRIKKLKKLKETVLICEHRLHYLKDLVDRVIYMKDGQIAKDCLADEFFSISDTKRMEMGLRVLDTSSVQVKSQKKTEQKQLRLYSISSGYKKKSIIHEVTFEADKGDIIGIVGHNGAGKSTLAETICGLNKVLSGKIAWMGKPVNEKQRQKLCYMVFQDVDYQLFADSVENECHYGLKNVDKDDVKQTLIELSLIDYREMHPATLSGGQKQRLAVAVSMVCDKDIIVFDEPTSGLDLYSMEKVTSLVKLLSEMGKLIFIVTHDVEFLSRVCSRVIEMKDGYLLEGEVSGNDDTASLLRVSKEREKTK